MVYAAILGFGVVGSGAAQVLFENQAVIEEHIGEKVTVRKILDLRDFPDSPFASLITHDFNDILSDPEITVVAEAMGGSHPAYDFTKAALCAGKNVVTSNKEVVARFGAELLDLAAQHGVRYLFEASVGGGIPVIRPMVNDLSANRIRRVDGILNGTTNYILSRMIDDGVSFDDALSEAQRKGYAEANPSADVSGMDAARKIVILAALAFGRLLSPEKIYCEGIEKLTAGDIAAARAFGCAVKLIGHTEQVDGAVLAMVSPRMVPAQNPLSGIGDVFNGILVDADMVGNVMFYGRGAGKLPTASAVVSDILDIVSNRSRAAVPAPHFSVAAADDYATFSDYRAARCLSFAGDGESLPVLLKIFGDHPHAVLPDRISILTDSISEDKAAKLSAEVGLPLVSSIRLL